jgi:hypothetical protein
MTEQSLAHLGRGVEAQGDSDGSARESRPLVEHIIVSAPMDPFLPLKALAMYSGLSVRKLRQCLEDPAHPVPCYRVGGKILVRRSEFDAWMAAYRQRGRTDVTRIVKEVLSGS